MLRQYIVSRACLRAPAGANSIIHPYLLLPCQFLQSSRRTLRTSGPPDSATPLPITAHGPPPKPPLPAVGEIREMRKKQRERAAELAGQGAAPAAEGNTTVPPPPPGTRNNGKPEPKLGLDTPGATPAKSTPGSRPRFWKESWVKLLPDGTHIPHLDSRALKTPQKQLLALPKHKAHVAQLIAHEWNLLTTSAHATRAYLLPITSLASRVIDLTHAGKESYDKERQDMVDMCMKYLDTDTLLCLHPPPNMYMMSEHVVGDGEGENTLRGRQLKVLADMLTWIDGNVFPGIVVHPLDTAQGFLPTTPQPRETRDRIRRWVEERDDWELVGLERCVVSAKSLLVGIRLVAAWGRGRDQPTSITDTVLSQKSARSPKIDSDPADPLTRGKEEAWGIEEAAQAATLEVSWQTGQWGEVEDTHDVEKEDVRRGLGAGCCLVINSHIGD